MNKKKLNDKKFKFFFLSFFCLGLILFVYSFAFGYINSKILIVKPDYGFIVIDQGSNQGIRLGEIFGIVYNNKVVGYLEVIKLRTGVSACSIKQLKPDFKLKPNDIIGLYRSPEEVPYTYKPEEKKVKVPEKVPPESLSLKAKKIEEKIIEEKQREELIKQAEKVAQDIINEKKKRLVSFNFKNADIQNVLRIFSQEVGINIIASDKIQGQVTVSFENVDFEDALEAILQQAGYTYTLEKNIYKVIPIEEAKKATITQVFTLKYAKVSTIKSVLTDGNLISDAGKIIIDEESNTLMIIDTKDNMEKIKSVIKELDIKPQQVSIEVKIVDVRLDKSENFGIEWSWVKPEEGKETDYTGKVGYYTKEGANEASGIFRYGTLDKAAVALLLDTLKTRKDTDILSKPIITTLNNEEAKINIVQKVAYISGEQATTTEAQTTTSVTFEEKEYGVTLSVTPHITKDEHIIMDVKPEASLLQEIKKVKSGTAEYEYPVIMSRSAETQVIIKDGQTLVIGGLVSKEKAKTIKRVPILSSIPILGVIFRKEDKTYVDTELLILITPHIVKEKTTSG